MKKIESFRECEICKLNAACLCYKCNSYFCEKCFKLIHDNQKDSTHKKEIIDPFFPVDFKCPHHPDHPIYLFCIDDKGK